VGKELRAKMAWLGAKDAPDVVEAKQTTEVRA
jgi:hypothetical protein